MSPCAAERQWLSFSALRSVGVSSGSASVPAPSPVPTGELRPLGLDPQLEHVATCSDLALDRLDRRAEVVGPVERVRIRPTGGGVAADVGNAVDDAVDAEPDEC